MAGKNAAVRNRCFKAVPNKANPSAKLRFLRGEKFGLRSLRTAQIPKAKAKGFRQR
jgi:hypothetical protein